MAEAVEDREIFVPVQYPAPPFVDGITRIVEDIDPDTIDWANVVDVDYSTSVEESDGIQETLQVPSPLEVIEQKAVLARGGGVEVQAVLVIEDIAGINDYEIRLVLR